MTHKMTDRIKELAKCLGAATVGVATKETLEGGPPSVDLTYVLPGAASAVSFLVPLDQRCIETYLRKRRFNKSARLGAAWRNFLIVRLPRGVDVGKSVMHGSRMVKRTEKDNSGPTRR